MKKRTKVIIAVLTVLVLAAGAFAAWHLWSRRPLRVSVCAYVNGHRLYPTAASTKTLENSQTLPAGFDEQGRMRLPDGGGPYSFTAVFDKNEIMRACPGGTLGDMEIPALRLEKDRTITVQFRESSKPNLIAANLVLHLNFSTDTGSWVWRDELTMERSGTGAVAISGEGESGTDTFYVNLDER